MARVLIKVPERVKRGEIFEIRVLVEHLMESGFRHDSNGVRIPRNIIHTFVCRYAGDEIFGARLYPAIAANPYLGFHAVATESGSITVTWTGDNGFSETASAMIRVE